MSSSQAMNTEKNVRSRGIKRKATNNLTPNNRMKRLKSQNMNVEPQPQPMNAEPFLPLNNRGIRRMNIEYNKVRDRGIKRNATNNLTPKNRMKKISPDAAAVIKNKNDSYRVTFTKKFINSLAQKQFESSLARKEYSQQPQIIWPEPNRPGGKGVNTLVGNLAVGTRITVPLMKQSQMSMHTHPMSYEIDKWYISLPSPQDILLFTNGATAKKGDVHFVLDTYGYYVVVVNQPGAVPINTKKSSVNNITKQFSQLTVKETKGELLKKIEEYYMNTIVNKFNQIDGVETVYLEEKSNNLLIQYHAFDRTKFPTLKDVGKKINEVLSGDKFFQHFKYYLYSETPSFSVRF